MGNPSTDDNHSTYYAAVSAADEQLEDAISALHREEEAGGISPAGAAARRIGLMEAHLAECRRARVEHLGGTP